MVKKSQTTTWDVKNPVNNGINYQPQLVSRIDSSINSIIDIHPIKLNYLMFFFPVNRPWTQTIVDIDLWGCVICDSRVILLNYTPEN